MKKWIGLGLVVVVALLAFNEFRPVALVAAAQTFAAPQLASGSAASIPWPNGAQAAFGSGTGIIALTAGEKAQPIASVAKVMTALAVLDGKPLQQGQSGPAITVTADDVNAYQTEKAEQSVVAVQEGEQLSELQALEAMLIPSGNNIAELLARWAFGSTSAAVTGLNTRARQMGMAQTRFADVSGFSNETVSTPADLVLMGEAAMANPVIASIVGMAQVSLPVAGMAYNVNYALGKEGIFGIKTGNIPQVGAVYLFAASEQLASGQKETLIGAVQGFSTLDGAFSSAETLLRAARASLVVQHVLSKGQTVGHYTLPWGGGTDVLATADLDILVWPGTVLRATLKAAAVNPPVSAQTAVGSLHVAAGDGAYDVPVTTADQLYAPGRIARLARVTW